jgi:DNA phosphorothioation system restriction enzyme
VSLKDLKLHHQYRSDRHNLLQDFYIPCLQQAITYDRAVGFFSSTSLTLAAQGLTAFISSSGKMRLIASPQLSVEDVAAIAQGLKQREEVIVEVVNRELEQEFDQIAQDRLACLAWLLSQEILEIKLAVYRDLRNQGVYHEKLGIFRDTAGYVVAFSGSANESESAYQRNFECLDVFHSWRSGDEERITEKLENFEQLWQNQTPELDVIDFPAAAKRGLLKHCPKQFPREGLEKETGARSQESAGRDGKCREIRDKRRKVEAQGISPNRSQEPKGKYEPLGAKRQKREDNPTSESWLLTPHSLLLSPTSVPSLPPWLTLRPYQQQAIDNWFANQGRGTLKMATGSGKTITALAIAAALFQKIGLQGLLIVCPYRHLVTQWAREAQKFGLDPILAFENVRSWQGQLSTQLYNVRSSHQPFLTVITTNATLISQSFQSQLLYFPDKTLIIGDEAHNLGSPQLEKRLPRNIGLRLALSATPERYFDDEGTRSLLNYFGPVLEPEFTLADAMRVGALVRYYYHPILIELTDVETKRYAELTAKIARVLSLEDDETDAAVAALSMQRAKLIGNAANKLVALRSLMSSRLQTSHTLFYCGDGSVEDERTADSNRQLNAVVKLLGSELGYRVTTYTAETSLDKREDLRQQFELGELQGLVAIRCLDEGVDIPAIETAVMLASSSNPRQFIQRRGRVLRPHPNKQRATLFDMIVLPPDLGRNTFEVERNLLRKELKRFLEFADLADNAAEARVKLLALQSQYGLLDV